MIETLKACCATLFLTLCFFYLVTAVIDIQDLAKRVTDVENQMMVDDAFIGDVTIYRCAQPEENKKHG